MIIGIPKEIMNGEGRVALTPDACKTLIEYKHQVFIQKNAGINSGYTDDNYLEAGATLTDDAEALYKTSELIVKVKQPLDQDIAQLTSHHVLFSYLHLAADPGLVNKLCDIGLTAFPFESVSSDAGHLPLLAPMSQVAGRIAVLRSASLLFRNRGGSGILLGGIAGTDPGHVVILGAGVAGSFAATTAAVLGAKVDVLDINEAKLSELKQSHPELNIHLSTPDKIDQLCLKADVVIGAVLVAGRRAPVVLKQSTINKMKKGSIIIDIAIDQGGCVEGIRATDSDEIYYIENGIVHSAVPNMPATVSRTASQALSSAILPYVLILANNEIETLKLSTAKMENFLYRAMAIEKGHIVDEVLKQEML